MNYFPRTNGSSAIALETELPLNTPERVPNSSWLDRQFRNGLLGRLKDLKGGSVVVKETDAEAILLGQSASQHTDLSATVVVRNHSFFRKIFLGGTIGSAESYMDGDWGTDNLTNLIRVIIRNLHQMTELEKGWARLKNAYYWMQHLGRKNSVEGSRKNIHEHYDLGNDFYQLFLDPTMSYSSGIFSDDDAVSASGMYDASIRKMDRICRKLQLQPNDHVLEIGTGWGGMAIHMARHFGCRVTTTTISREQHRHAVEAVRQAGLQDQITVLLKDYRHLEGQFDKIVSIEMIEAVGHQYYDQYFSKCSSLLADDGLMLLQAITMSEQNFDYHIRHVDFIRRYVFPGGCLPSITALSQSVGRVTDMRSLHTEDITPHYVTTLQCWRRAFLDRLDDVRELGYDESFIRLWNFYLCYCEAAFAERRVHLTHLVYSKPGCEIDPAQDYVLDGGLSASWKTRKGDIRFLNSRTNGRFFNTPERLMAQINSC